MSVTMATTSVGVAFNNLGLAWAGGALTGAAIAYWKKSYIYLLLGPPRSRTWRERRGSTSTQPWQMFLARARQHRSPCYIAYEFSASAAAGTSTS